MTRPWSPAEIEEQIPQAIDDLNDAVLGLREAYENAAGANHRAKHAKSVATLKISGRNREEREARVYLHQIEPGVTVGQLEYEAELAEGIYRSETYRVRALEKKADLLQSLHVTARAART